MNRPLTLASLALALSAGLVLPGCDRNLDTPIASTDPASAVPGTTNTETAGSTVTSPDTTIQQNPSAAGGLSGPGGTTAPGAGMTGSSGTGTTGTGSLGTSGTMDGTMVPGATGSPNVNAPANNGTGVTGDSGTGNTGTSGSR